MPGVNERMCGFACVSTLAPVFAVSESLIAVTLRDRQACAKTMASKSWRLTATDSHLPPKHTSGPLRSPPTTPSFCFFSLCRGRLRRLRDKEEDVINWHLSSRFVLVRTQRTFVKVLKDILKDFILLYSHSYDLNIWLMNSSPIWFMLLAVVWHLCVRILLSSKADSLPREQSNDN